MALQKRRLRQAVRTAGVVILGLAGACLVLELGVRYRQSRRYGNAFSIHSLHIDEASGLRVPNPGDTRGEKTSFHINRFGFRGPELDQPKPAHRVRLAFLGSSTTYCAEVSSDALSWPQLVTESFKAAHPDLEFDYLNASSPGFVLERSLANLEHRVKPHQPDVVVIYEGVNDLTQDTRGLTKNRGPEFDAHNGSGTLAWSLTWKLIELQLQVRRLISEAREGKNRLVYDPAPLAAEFKARMKRVILKSQEIAPVVAVVTFSHRIRRDQTREAQLIASQSSLLFAPWMSLEGLLDGFDAYNRAIREAGEETGAIVIGGEDSIPGDAAHFADSVHFSDQGSRLQAKRIFEALERAPSMAALLKADRS